MMEKHFNSVYSIHKLSQPKDEQINSHTRTRTHRGSDKDKHIYTHRHTDTQVDRQVGHQLHTSWGNLCLPNCKIH